jgi:hypothetical protein
VEVVRVELKYSVPEDLAAWALRWSGVFLGRDRGMVGPQRVTSLYLDTPTLTFFRWHREKRADRFKLRIRGYGDRSHELVWAEIKRKAGVIVHKQRAPLPVLALDSILAGHLPETLADTPTGDLAEFMKRRKAFLAAPILLVSCERDALRERGAWGELAVTVDRNIRYQPTSQQNLIANPQGWTTLKLPQAVEPSAAIIEVKYLQQPPAWMATLMRKLAPYQLGFSKYRAAMQQHSRRMVS